MSADIKPYIGSKISLVSNADIRYEGTLWKLDQENATISLSKVRSFGTENRRSDKVIPPRDEVYEFIIFRGSDIKDLVVCEPPVPEVFAELMGPVDPAIVEVSTKTVGTVAPSTSGPAAAPVPCRTSSSAPNDREGRPQRNETGEMSRQGGQWNNNYRGGRGRGAYSRQGNYDGGNRNYGSRNTYFQNGGRERQEVGERNEQPDQTQQKVTDTFDFEASNQTLKEVEEKLKAIHTGEGQAAEKNEEEPTSYYNPDKFFDSISCEAVEKQKDDRHAGGRPGYNRQLERDINAMTFGISALPMNRTRSFQNQNRQQGDRGGYRGGYGGYNNNYNNYGGGGYNNGYGQQRRGGQRYYSGSNSRGGQSAPRQQDRAQKRGGRQDRSLRPLNTDGDWVYDQRDGWVNYKDPIAKRNQLLIRSVLRAEN